MRTSETSFLNYISISRFKMMFLSLRILNYKVIKNIIKFFFKQIIYISHNAINLTNEQNIRNRQYAVNNMVSFIYFYNL